MLSMVEKLSSHHNLYGRMFKAETTISTTR